MFAQTQKSASTMMIDMNFDSNLGRQNARKLFLRQQGLLQKNSFGRGSDAVNRAISQMGYLQIDTISVVNRAHVHILKSRISKASTEDLNALMKSRDLFEYWSHAAAFQPIENYRFATPVMNGWQASRDHDRKLAIKVKDRIRAEGPLQSKDFESPAGHKSGGWWDWKPTKRVLEHLFFTGELMVSHREGFQKVYDLKENILPSHIDTREPSIQAWAEHLVRSMVNALGVATEYDIGYSKSTVSRLCKISLATPIKTAIRQLIHEGELIEANVDNRIYYTTKLLLESLPLRTSRKAVKVLSPFDNLIINRRRALELFDFDYQLECYVPAEKRKYGYFALPLLWGDDLIGRLDAKAVRSKRILELRSLVLEPKVQLDDHLISALNEGIRLFAADNSCETIKLLRCSPKKLKTLIAAEY